MALTQTFKVTVRLNPSSTPEDAIINTWHFASRDSTAVSAAFDAATAALNGFYQAIDAQLSVELTGQQPDMYGWNYIEPKPRQPFDYFVGTTLACGSTKGPREVAACVSYRAEYESGVTPKRRRGRIYIGPLSAAIMDTSTGLFGSALVTALQGAADSLVTASAASSTWAWVVYSPTTDVAGTGETGMYEVVSGWVDNLPDIQRRRGLRTGTKSLFAP